MRVFVARPQARGRYPGFLLYSDIFQLTPTMLRACIAWPATASSWLAPEIYHRLEPPARPPPSTTRAGPRGSTMPTKTAIAEFDADAQPSSTTWPPTRSSPTASLLPEVLHRRTPRVPGGLATRRDATACFYPTGVHDGKLGLDPDAGTLAGPERSGASSLVFGTARPPRPRRGPPPIEAGLKKAGTQFTIKLYPAEHAFMRDEGPRYDPEQTDRAFGAMVAMFRGVSTAG